MKFNEIIKQRRQELNLTLEEVAKVVGVSAATISRWESGEIENMRRDKVGKLATALKVTSAFIMGWSDDDVSFAKKSVDELRLHDRAHYIKKFSAKDCSLEAIESTLQSIAFYSGREVDDLFDPNGSEIVVNGIKIPFPVEPDFFKDDEHAIKKIGAYQTTRLYKIPIYSVIHAGQPMFAAENIEGYEFADVAIPEDYFFLRVQGDSMINANIREGYKVLIKKQNRADNGQIVVCMLNDEDATIKRYRETKDIIILQPENSKYEPMFVSKNDFESGYARILGIVIKAQFDVI